MPTPTSLLFDVLAKSRFSLFELTDSRLELIMAQAMRKTPIPAMRDKTAVAIWTGVINKLFLHACACVWGFPVRLLPRLLTIQLLSSLIINKNPTIVKRNAQLAS